MQRPPNPLLYEIVDPRLVKRLLLDYQIPIPLKDDSPVEDAHKVLTAIETRNNANGIALLASKPRSPDVTRETIVIPGVDGNDITLYLIRPKRLHPDEIHKCVVYIHGGGMGLYSAVGTLYAHFSEDIAATSGCTVIAVEFRNSTGALGSHPFPAGLNDCKSALSWVYSQKETRKFSKIILCGESGGANLSIATTLAMKQEGKISYIDGLYVMCPYISNLYDDVETEEAKQLPSLHRLDKCGIIDLQTCQSMARMYNPTGENARNPLAWPYWATVEDLEGFPQTAVSVNEADLLLDEGLAFYRKLQRAGVEVRCRNVLGTPHAGDLICMSVLPSLYISMLYDIRAFVDAL
jgi:acetyl esterase/lipase